ncbi:MAG TPA: hypothetical protein VIM44_07765 [Rariglobus sp.]
MKGTDHSHHLKELECFFSNPAICRDSFRLLIHFAIRLAAVGHTAEVLALVERSPESKLFQPLADGLRLHLNQPVESVGRSLVLALQIAGKIEDEIASHQESLAVA